MRPILIALIVVLSTSAWADRKTAEKFFAPDVKPISGGEGLRPLSQSQSRAPASRVSKKVAEKKSIVDSVLVLAMLD